MSAIDRGFESLSLSDSLREALRRRMRELIGLALIVFAMLLVAALGSWSVQDPSLSHATNAPVRNLLGLPGAIVADLMMQLFGIASVALVLPIAVWGWRLASHRALYRERLRLLAWVAAVVLTASFAACLPRTAAWPLPAGLGGVTGDALLRFAVWIAGNDVLGLARLIVGVAAGVGASLALALTLGFGWQAPAEVEAPRKSRRKVKVRDEEDEEEEQDEEDAAARQLDLARLLHARIPQPQGAAGALARAPHAPSASPSASRRRNARTAGSSRASATTRPRCTSSRWRTATEEDEDEDDETPRARKPRAAAPKPQRRRQAIVLPSLDLLSAPKARERTTLSSDLIQANATALEGVLGDFGVRGEIINARPGPVVTLYELEPAPGIKSSRVIGLSDDIARSMSALSARVAVVSGRNAIGIELPNPNAREGLSARIARGRRLQRNLGQAAALPRQDHRRRARDRRSHAHAASADRRHHRLRQVGRHQHHDPEPALPAHAGPVPADHGRSEDARTLGLRRDPASADAGRHRPEEGDGRAQVGGARDGRALQEDVEARRAQHRRLQRARRRGQGEGREALPHRPHRLRQGIAARRSTRPRSSISSRCPTSSSSWTRWPT